MKIVVLWRGGCKKVQDSLHFLTKGWTKLGGPHFHIWHWNLGNPWWLCIDKWNLFSMCIILIQCNIVIKTRLLIMQISKKQYVLMPIYSCLSAQWTSPCCIQGRLFQFWCHLTYLHGTTPLSHGGGLMVNTTFLDVDEGHVWNVCSKSRLSTWVCHLFYVCVILKSLHVFL